ncbi:MAG: HD domain-containing protein [Bacteroidales bacterium]|nr:HD domain-containing protein [Bacteroidales bacterium]
MNQDMYFKIVFCKNTIFFSLLLVIFLILLPLKSYEKNIGNPYIQRIVLQNYGFSNNNFSLIQDFNGINYIANTNGILQYDGHSWEIIKVSGTPCIDIDKKGVIYVGAYNDFGFIKNKPNGSLFFSLSDSLKKDFSSLGQIKQISTNQDQIYFCNDKMLFKWTGTEIELIDSSAYGLSLFKTKDQTFLVKNDVGIFKLTDDEFLFLPGSNLFANKKVIDIVLYNEQVLIKTLKDRGFFLFNGFSFDQFNTKADIFLENSIYSKACELSNGNYAIGTLLSGIIIINKKGEIVSLLDENSGLFNLSINSLFADKNNNLWALHNKGISRIEVPSPFSYFSKANGLNGHVNSVIRFKNSLYVATSLGVYKCSNNEKRGSLQNLSFIAIKEIKSNCYDFHQFNDQLFVSCSKGIYEIIENKARLFYNREANEIISVFRSKKNSSYIFLGYNDGFSAIRYAEGILIIEKKLNGIKGRITSITEDNDGTLWLSGNERGIYKINPFNKYNINLEFTHYNKSNKLPENLEWINLHTINDGILFSTSQGIFRFDSKKQAFYKDTLIGIDFINENNWVYPIVRDNEDNLWLNIIGQNSSPNKTLVKNYKNDSLETLRSLPLNRVQDFFITSIQPDENKVVWFGGLEGLIRLDLNQEIQFDKTFMTSFHQITIGKDSVIYQLPFGTNYHDKSKKAKITYNLNTIAFKFSAPHYESESQIFYQYKLEGYDSDWLEWTNSNFKEYTNLFEGEYIFRLKAKNVFDAISEEVSYEFSIVSPFYRTKTAFVIYIISTLLFFLLIGKWRDYYYARERFKLENIIYERTEEVVIQKEKADNLLERVLPKNTAKELKSGRKAGPYHYNMVTVLFSDIQGFTKIADQMDSDLLIDELDRFFLQFDTVVETYNIEKIKTIGDAYMCAGGIPIKNRTNPVEVVLAAIEMQNFMKRLKEQASGDTSHIWDLRIGIDTGPVVAGVLGRSKISYDIWGGTVNTASRMEASGEPGKINITENTYMLIKDFFICKYRGKMPVKYKGEIDMYFVEGLMPHLSSDLKGQIPNQDLFTQVQLLRVNDVEEFVLTKLEDGLPDNLYYHNVKHTIDVVTQVELIGRSEGVKDEDMLILKTAALFHDLGHLVNYDTHEVEGAKLARKFLPDYHYSDKQIERICSIILVTQMPPEPKNLLEEIMCDADLDYLGRTDFVPVSINLYKEFHERNKIDSILEWNKMQFNFIKNHQYFTKTAQKLREVNKNMQLDNIQIEIQKEVEIEDE